MFRLACEAVRASPREPIILRAFAPPREPEHLRAFASSRESLFLQSPDSVTAEKTKQ